MGRFGEFLASQGWDPEDVSRREEMYTCITVFFLILFLGAQGALFAIPDPQKIFVAIAAGKRIEEQNSLIFQSV